MKKSWDALMEDDPRFQQLIEARRESYRLRGGIPLAAVRETVMAELEGESKELPSEKTNGQED